MRTKIHIEIGQIFERLTVIAEANPVKNSSGKIITRKFLCKCSCGKEKIVSKGNLSRGNVRSCGCLLKDWHKPYGYKFKYPELYSKYKSAKGRCNNPNSASYKNYGARGIKFLFTGGFVKFAEYCLSVGWKPGLQIDRIDNNDHYREGNIRFVSSSENQQNTRRTVFITAFGETKTLKQWTLDSRCSIDYRALVSRLRLGWPAEKAIEVPKHYHLKFS